MVYRAIGQPADTGDLEDGTRVCRVCETRKPMTNREDVA